MKQSRNNRGVIAQDMMQYMKQGETLGINKRGERHETTNTKRSTISTKERTMKPKTDRLFKENR